MKFQLIVRVCLIFYTYDSANCKKHGNNTMKKMLLASTSALLITGCAQQTFTVQNKPAAVAPKKPSPIISSFLELGRKKTVDAAKICGGAENIVKTKPANIRKWIARFYYFRHLYSAGSACVLLTIIAWVAARYGQLYLPHCSLIYFWVRWLFLHSDQPLSGVK